MDRQHGRLAIACDTCGEIREQEDDENDMPYAFTAFVEGAKADGWRFVRDMAAGGGWLHYCAACGARRWNKSSGGDLS